MLLQAVALRYTSIIRGRLRMHGGVDHGGVYALLGTAGPRRPNIATGAQAIVRYPRATRPAGDKIRRIDVIAIGDGCYLDSTFFTGANDPVEPECRPAPPAGRKLSSQKGQTAAVVLCASLLGLGLAFFACTQLIPALGPGWSDAVCLGGNSNPQQTARTDE